MDRSHDDIVERLGSAGLERALTDVLDQGQLVRLATACGVSYRGMRTQSQSRDRLIRDLVAKAGKQNAARQAIVQTLRKETGTAMRDWGSLAAEQQAERLSDEQFLRAEGNLGLHLFLLATTPAGADLDRFGSRFAHLHLLRIASNGAGPPASARGDRETARLRRKLAEQDKKMRHADNQLAKSRELHKTVKRDLIQRKGELAESRMLVERLRRELAAAQTAAGSGGTSAAKSSPDPGLAELATAVRKLSSGQRKLTHQLGKLADAPAPEKSPADPATELREALDPVRKELNRHRQDLRKELAAQTGRLDELRAELRALRESASETRSPRRSRARGASARVGVFIDVQNVYYGARQLKGKLDFDKLLQAAVADRRLIQATAYVVESKETDQSHFIAMLEERAIRVRRKALKVRADGSMKGDWDVEIALDVLDVVPQLDVVVLVSGDGDFASLTERVKALGPRVEVLSFPRTAAKALIEAADHFQPLDRNYMIQTKRRGRVGGRPPAATPASGAAGPASGAAEGAGS